MRKFERKVFNGEKLFLVAEQGSTQSMGYVLISRDKKVIVVDGGTAKEADVLEEYLLQNGGRVSAWFFTHAHSDHINAATEILGRGKIAVETIVYRFPPEMFIVEVEPKELSSFRNFQQAVEKTKARVFTLGAGDQFQFDSVTITALNDCVTTWKERKINNTSIALRAETGGKSILFLGDMEREAGDMLIAAHPDLRGGLVQMSHHGNGGVGREVYESLQPEICLWNTPVWLWNNDNGGGIGSGNWTTLETRKWMEELGVTDHIVSKDGCIEIF